MINHALALLMNVDGSQNLVSEPGGEYLPSAYRPVTLSAELRTVRRLLFGDTPDKAMLRYRCRQLLSLVHSCELEEFVLALDPRITYDFRDRPYFDPAVFAPRVYPVQSVSGAATTLYANGQDDPPDRTGRMLRVWDVELLTATTARVALRQPAVSGVQSLSYTNGLSSSLTLPGSGITALVQQVSFPDNQGPRWRIESLARPQLDPGQLLVSLGSMGAAALAALFADGTTRGGEEPRLTLRRCYEDHFDLPHRLGAAVVALVYETEFRRAA